jgi:hypothetical protein
MISHDKSGGRTIYLFIPFEFAGKKVEQITLAPLRFGHVLRWNEGAWKTMVELLVELAGVEESVIRELRYPDADRVMEAFMAILTPEIRNDIAEGRIPMKPDMEPELPEPNFGYEATNGSGQPVGPGVPLPPEQPQPGFDLSEEP